MWGEKPKKRTLPSAPFEGLSFYKKSAKKYIYGTSPKQGANRSPISIGI